MEGLGPRDRNGLSLSNASNMQSLNMAVNAPNGPEVAPKVLNQNVTQVPAPAGEGSKVSRLALAPLAPEVSKVPPCLLNLGVEVGVRYPRGGRGRSCLIAPIGIGGGGNCLSPPLWVPFCRCN